MALNRDKTHLWKADVEESIDFYNRWFLRFAPQTYRNQRSHKTREVIEAFHKSENLTKIDPVVLLASPEILPILRMSSAPPLARDRLMGLAYVKKSLIETLEGKDGAPGRLPPRMPKRVLKRSLQSICDVVLELLDRDLFPWLDTNAAARKADVERAATVVADRLCGAAADPIIRNEQEKRQLANLKRWLTKRGYRFVNSSTFRDPRLLPAGAFCFRLTLHAGQDVTRVNVPVDCVIKPVGTVQNAMPVLIEAKSAGDATNTNKRRKEEAEKYNKLKQAYGSDVQFLLLLCGYFETGYLGYEAAEGIDWVWEHRIDDLSAIVPAVQKKNGVPRLSDDEGEYIADADEHERFVRQRQVDVSKPAGERNRSGQFSTPYALASQIAANALAYLDEELPVSFIEPALGSGVFFSALRQRLGKRRLVEAVGVEMDPAYAEIAQDLWSEKGLSVVQDDFLRFSKCSQYGRHFTFLCTNPPYVRHHHLPSELKVDLQERVRHELGLSASGLSGLYVYFVLLAHSILGEKAVASWLLPSEFLCVNYGKVLRDYLMRHVTLLSIHQFDAEDVQFDDALVSSCVVTYRKEAPKVDHAFLFCRGSDVCSPRESQMVSIQDMARVQKWTIAHINGEHEQSASGYKLGDFFTIKRGLATGCNKFFILAAEDVQRLGIPKEFVRPILPSPRALTQEVVERNDDGSPCLNEIQYLLDCEIPPAVVEREYPELWRYLQSGVEQGIKKGYICSSREEWYYQEHRPPAPYLATYMGRGGDENRSPFRFIFNRSNAVVSNVYLNLYPTETLARILEQDERKQYELVRLLNDLPVASVVNAGRSYGGGLHKIEPRELLEVSLNQVPEWLAAACIKQPLLV